jgi:hypothetical protein
MDLVLATLQLGRMQLGVTNGCADNMSGTSEVPKLAAPLCATRKSAEVGQQETLQAVPHTRKLVFNLKS